MGSTAEELAPGGVLADGRLLGESERALGEVVALHLVGAATNRDAVAAHELGADPDADLILRLQRVRARELTRHVAGDRLVECDRQLEDRRVDRRPLPATD